MSDFTIEQQRAIAIAAARARAAQAQPAQPMKFDPTEGMSTWDKTMAGAGKAVADAGRGIGQMLGMVSPEDVRDSRQRDAALMDTTAGTLGNIGGNIAMAALPGAALKGVGAVAGMPAVEALGSTLMAPNTVGSALTVGGIQGALQPAETGSERAFNAGLGAAATAVVPVAKAAKSVVEPFYESGRQQIMGRVLRGVAGDEADQVAQRLAQAGEAFVGPQRGTPKQVMGELVAGSMPTTGQAAGNAGIAALERSAFAAEPSVTVPVSERMAAQNTARVNALRDLAGEGGARDFAVANRQATADELYRQAYDLGIDLGAMSSSRKGEITKLLKRPAIQKAVEDARTLALNEGVNIKNPSGSVKGLDYVKRALDDQISKVQGNEQRVLVDLKNRLLTTIDTLSPEYAAARKVFADMSVPVNQMDTAAEIAKRSIRPLDDQLMPGKYAAALNDVSAQRATGFNKATLEGTMAPDQLASLNAIKEDLARAEFAKNAGRGVGSDTVQKMAYNNFLDQSGLRSLPNLLSRPVQMAEYLGRTIYGSANKEMQRKLAEALLNPQEAAQMMQAATPTARQQALSKALRYAVTPPLMATPALLNAQQQ